MSDGAQAGPRPLPYSWPEVKAELQLRIRGVLDALGLTEAERNGLVTPLNPRRADRHPGSFVIWTHGDGIGAWKDYAIGRQGDVFDLIQYIGGLQAKIDAYWWALDFLGWGRGEVRSAAQAEQDRRRAEDERQARAAKAKQDADAKAGRALDAFIKARKDIRDTPVWTYLTETRGLPLDQLGRLPGALRYERALDHYDEDTGEITTWPAMVSGMSHWETGQVRAVHRTWVRPDGRGKADVAKAKKMWGDTRGCAIRLWKGAGELTPEAAARAGVRGPLVITEGIEDGITAAIAQPAYRVWAAGSLSLMGALGWPPCASAVVLVADNDWHEPQAMAAFEKVEAHWRSMAAGRPVKVVRAEAGKDLNDWAREGRNGGEG